jgi:ribonuclease P protein component
VRNRTKRRVRGLLVQDIARLPTGIDVVVRANPAAGRASSMELAGSLGPLLDRVIRKIRGAA